jgi:streptogramin lyase
VRILLRHVVRVLLCLCVLPAQAQEDTLFLPLRAITIEDGLSQGMVNSIVQDRYGYMWLATKDGLNRYDGYTFTVFRHDPEDSTTVRSNYIYTLMEDRQGRLWVGTAEGIDLFDRTTETFRHMRAGMEHIRDIVQSITQDKHGDLWVGHSQGVVKLTFTGDKMPEDCRSAPARTIWIAPASPAPTAQAPSGWVNWTGPVSGSTLTTEERTASIRCTWIIRRARCAPDGNCSTSRGSAWWRTPSTIGCTACTCTAS